MDTVWFNEGDLVCPNCGGILSKVGGQHGLLACDSAHVWPIWKGVANFLSGDMSDDAERTIASFNAKWNHDPEAMREERVRIANAWFLRRFGFDGDSLTEALAGKHRILDAGCGLGNLTTLHAEHAPHAEVWGVDMTMAVLEIGLMPNLRVVRGDLRKLPIIGKFDWIISDGVLHHTDDTKESLRGLVDRLVPSGEILFYVYKKKAPIREFADDHIREYVTKLDIPEALVVSEALADLGRQLREAKVTLNITKPIPVLGIEAGEIDLHRFVYWNMLKCFWDDGGNVVASMLENFDWYHPALAHRHTESEVKGWLRMMGLDVVSFVEEPSGFAVRASLENGKR